MSIKQVCAPVWGAVLLLCVEQLWFLRHFTYVSQKEKEMRSDCCLSNLTSLRFCFKSLLLFFFLKLTSLGFTNGSIVAIKVAHSLLQVFVSLWPHFCPLCAYNMHNWMYKVKSNFQPLCCSCNSLHFLPLACQYATHALQPPKVVGRGQTLSGYWATSKQLTLLLCGHSF